MNRVLSFVAAAVLAFPLASAEDMRWPAYPEQATRFSTSHMLRIVPNVTGQSADYCVHAVWNRAGVWYDYSQDDGASWRGAIDLPAQYPFSRGNPSINVPPDDHLWATFLALDWDVVHLQLSVARTRPPLPGDDNWYEGGGGYGDFYRAPSTALSTTSPVTQRCT
jgi:hypothetical protein